MSVVALDIGTSHLKAVLAEWDGTIVAVARVRTPVESRAPGRLAFPADAVLARARGLVASLCSEHPGSRVDTLAMSCLGTAMVPLDAAGRPLGPAISPADARPASVPDLMAEVRLDPEELRARTGSDPATPSSLMHWLWWRRSHPEAMAALRRFRSLRGYVLEALTGEDAEDHSWASRTMLYDLETAEWSAAILAAAGLPREVLPSLHPSTASWQALPAEAARFGLTPGARVVLGGMDNGCSHLGALDPAEQRLVNIAGTFEHMAGTAALPVVRAVAARCGAIVHAYVMPDRHIAMTRVPVGRLLAAVARAAPGSLDRLLDGVPAGPSEESIDLDEEAVRRALANGVPPEIVLRRVLGSSGARLVAFARAWQECGESVDRVVVVGGGASRGNLLQLKANVLGRSVSTLVNDEGAALGALRLAAIAVRGASPAGACELFADPVRRTWQPRSGPADRSQSSD